MSYQLVPTGKGPFSAISLQRPVLLIGRHPECDVRIDLPKISRRHCCVALAYDRVLIRDLGSHNGLRVNGQVVASARLSPGDEIAIGPLIYRLVSDAAVASPTRPSKPLNTAARSINPAPASAPVAKADDIGLVPIDDH